MNIPQLYLASSSPRRSGLLKQLKLDFQILHPNIDETAKAKESPADFVQRLALEKAQAGLQLLEENMDAPVLGADTVVVIDNEIVGKPEDKHHAITMLQRLSGNVHQVLTAIAMSDKKQHAIQLSKSLVWFRTLSPEEIEAYWQTKEPKDKAGAYAIQGLGAVFVKRIEGSYSGVMGLPLYETAELLGDFAIKVL